MQRLKKAARSVRGSIASDEEGPTAAAPEVAGACTKRPGMLPAVVQRSTSTFWTSFVASTRPSFLHSRNVSKSTGPYSLPSTRTIHSSVIPSQSSICHSESSHHLSRNHFEIYAIQLILFLT